MSQAYGQRRHDLRIGSQPNYVDQSRNDLNCILIDPCPLPDIRNEIRELRKRRGAQRALKSNAAIIKSGIVTFGVEAAKMFDTLSSDCQNKAFLELTQLLAERLNTRLESLVVHLDETTIHAHFELRAFSDDGQPVCKLMDRAAMSEFQDITADIMKRYCPEIERGNRKKSRLDAGANHADTLNRSVRQLHAELPAEIAAKKQEVDDLNVEITARKASIRTDQKRIEALGVREDLSAKEVKRLGVYRARIAKKITALNEIEVRQIVRQKELERRERLAKKSEQKTADDTKTLAEERAVTAEKSAQADTERSNAKRVTAAYETGIAAVEAIVEEMANDTIHETQDEITLHNPDPIIAASKLIQKRLTKIVHRYLDLQHTWHKQSAWLDAMVEKLQFWLSREDLPSDVKNAGEKIKRDFDDEPNM